MHCSYSRSHQGGVHLTPPASYVPRVSLPCARMYAPLMGGERRSPLTPRPFYCNASHLLVLRCRYLLFKRVGKGEAAGFTGLNSAAFRCAWYAVGRRRVFPLLPLPPPLAPNFGAEILFELKLPLKPEFWC